MAIDVDKLVDLDYTAYDDAQDFQEGMEEHGIDDPAIEVGGNYDMGTPVVDVKATDRKDEELVYYGRYYLENVTEEEAEEVMFDIYYQAMKELER